MTNFHFILQSLFILLGFDTLVLSELPRPRGVSISRAAIYTPKETFLCEDGSKTIKYIQINDDFCDCGDGSDEPGTSACSNGIFHCMNLGHRPKNIPSSRVNDGICDCCDASDEYNSSSQCVNNCMELGREERQRERNRQELIKKGTMLRADLINKGKSLKDERNKKMVELQNRKTESEAIREEKEARKKEAEAAEQEALEVYRQIQEAENREKMEKDADANRKEAEDTFTKFDSNKDGFVEIIEIQTRVAFDKDRDGVVTVEEAKFFLSERDRVDLETFVTLAWPLIKPYLMLDSGLFKPPLTESENEYENESELDNQDYSGSEQQHEEQNEEITDTDATKSGDEDEDEEHIEDENEEGEVETATAKEYDPETQKLIDLANTARSEFLETDRTVREIEDEIKETRELIQKDYGIEEEFAPLDGECFTFEDREYVYKLCPFDRASQQPRSGGSEVRLGSWHKWSGNENENKYSEMLYSNGASCWNGPQRSAAVSVECGLENKITSVSEPNRCEYHFVFQTPAACYLVDDTQKKDFHDEL